MINVQDVDWVRLTRFASDVTLKATGKACVVRGGFESGCWGSAGFDGRFYEIELTLSQPREQLARTFLHELGHCANNHPRRTIKSGGLTLRTVDYVEDAAFREGVRARLHTIESEADAFADAAQGIFEQEMGMAWREWPFVGTVAGNRA